RPVKPSCASVALSWSFRPLPAPKSVPGPTKTSARPATAPAAASRAAARSSCRSRRPLVPFATSDRIAVHRVAEDVNELEVLLRPHSDEVTVDSTQRPGPCEHEVVDDLELTVADPLDALVVVPLIGVAGVVDGRAVRHRLHVPRLSGRGEE